MARTPVPQRYISELRSVCLELPEAREETAWVGTRWCIRKKTFAHVLMISEGWPPAYARAAGSHGTICVLTFRTAGPEVDPPRFAHPPFFRPVWLPNIIGVVLDDRTNWEDVGKLVVASYRVLAPNKLAAQIEGPP